MSYKKQTKSMLHFRENLLISTCQANLFRLLTELHSMINILIIGPGNTEKFPLHLYYILTYIDRIIT